MSHPRKSRPVVLAAALLLLASVRKANAYVDPGSGAMLWQLAAASVIGVLFYVRSVTAWVRRRLGLRSARSTGFFFATSYALVASPLVLAIFHAQPIPRFNDIFLVGIVLTTYLFTWESAVYLLAISIGVSAYVLQVYVSGRSSAMPDVYRLISFTSVCVFLICLITRLKAKAAKPESAVLAPPDEPTLPGKAAGEREWR